MVVLTLLLILKFAIIVSSDTNKEIEELIGLNTTQIIQKLGYPVEVHTIQTKDGYMLEVHRIPHGRYKNSSSNFSPVLIYSGLLGDSSSYISNGRDESLGFILADKGYDVWLGNNRGTTNCKKHIKLDPYKNKKQFWDFSFQEMAAYDLPDTIDYILNKTKRQNLYYIGHSQGSTSVFAMLADNPVYNQKIKLLVAICPIISTTHSSSPFVSMLEKDLPYFLSLVKKNQYYEFFPLTKETKKITKTLCRYNSTFQEMCVFFVCIMFGGTYEQTSKAMLPVIISNLPAGASTKQLVHYMQLRSGEFKKFDYGSKKNLKRYQSETPPIYNISNIRVPTVLFYGSADVLADRQVRLFATACVYNIKKYPPTNERDVETLASELPHVVYQKRIGGFNHVDLVFGNDATKMVTIDIVNLFNKYN